MREITSERNSKVPADPLFNLITQPFDCLQSWFNDCILPFEVGKSFRCIILRTCVFACLSGLGAFGDVQASSVIARSSHSRMNNALSTIISISFDFVATRPNNGL